MKTRIGEVRGYTVAYDTNDKLFHLLDPDGESVASAKTQDEVEAQALKLSKQRFNLPIEALTTSGLRVEFGHVTSVNLSEPSCRFVYDAENRSHRKLNLRYQRVYEAPNHNREIAAEVSTREEKVAQLETEIRGFVDQFEKRIDEGYFKQET